MLKITGKHIDITDAMRSHAEEQFSKLEGHFDMSEKSISIGKERHLFKVVTHGSTLHGVEATGIAEDTDCYKAMNVATKKLRTQIEKKQAKMSTPTHTTLNDIEPVEEDDYAQSA